MPLPPRPGNTPRNPSENVPLPSRQQPVSESRRQALPTQRQPASEQRQQQVPEPRRQALPTQRRVSPESQYRQEPPQQAPQQARLPQPRQRAEAPRQQAYQAPVEEQYYEEEQEQQQQYVEEPVQQTPPRQFGQRNRQRQQQEENQNELPRYDSDAQYQAEYPEQQYQQQQYAQGQNQGDQNYNQYPQGQYAGNQQQQSQGSGVGANLQALLGFILSFVFSPAGLVFSILGFRKAKKINVGAKLSLAGMIISGVSILATCIFVVPSLFALGGAANDLNGAINDLNATSTDSPSGDTEIADGVKLKLVAVPSASEEVIKTLDGTDKSATNMKFSGLDPTVYTEFAGQAGVYNSTDLSAVLFVVRNVSADMPNIPKATASQADWDAYMNDSAGKVADLTKFGAPVSVSPATVDQYGNPNSTVVFDSSSGDPQRSTVSIKVIDNVVYASVVMGANDAETAYYDEMAINVSSLHS